MDDDSLDLAPSDLSSPIAKLLDLIQSGFGAIWEMHGIRRRARAEADGLVVKAEAEVEVARIRARASDRMLAGEVKRQLNLENVLRRGDAAIPLHARSGERKLPEDDWVAAFMNCAQDVSNAQMQQLWGKLLAAEIMQPGSFSRRTLSVVRDLGAQEAREFAALCAWRVQLWDPPDVYLIRPPKENRRAPSHDLDNLAAVGLVYVDRDEFFGEVMRTVPFDYGGISYKAEFTGDSNADARYKLPLGIAQLTRAGHELACLVPRADAEELPPQIVEYWQRAKWDVRLNAR